MLRNIILGLVMGATLGVTLAAEVFNRIGMEPETYKLLLAGFVVAALLLNRGVGMLAMVSMLTIAILQPEQVLLDHGFDKDMLMATLLATVMFPVVERVMHS